ncbi:MAG: ABC transporter ATP-binding protein [Vicinamibacterales bacterium]|nr:ABC transporter ATP-binding protein [Vicinamibacterales bacterium]
MTAIQLDELSKEYPVGFWRPRPYRALDSLSLSVEPGEVFGCLGPNGAGKTTTLKLLLHLVRPTSGRAEILGQPVGDATVRRRIGYLPENPAFYDHLSGEELLEYFAGLFGYSRADARRRASARLDEVGLGAERRLPLRKYSKGMVQRVGIAQALINDPEVVFLDEPMSGLDPIGRRDVRALILRLRDRGCTVFFSSHVLADAEALCSRVAILAKGRLVASGRVSDLLAFRVHGWELVVSRITRAAIDARIPGVRVVEIGHDRFAVEVPLDTPPERILQDLVACGASLVSLNPMRETLEDFFVESVAAAPPRGQEAG